jgi:hypothetical protein
VANNVNRYEGQLAPWEMSEGLNDPILPGIRLRNAAILLVDYETGMLERKRLWLARIAFPLGGGKA